MITTKAEADAHNTRVARQTQEARERPKLFRQCQFAQFSTEGIPRCPWKATRKFGDLWFCDEHGKRETLLCDIAGCDKPGFRVKGMTGVRCDFHRTGGDGWYMPETVSDEEMDAMKAPQSRGNGDSCPSSPEIEPRAAKPPQKPRIALERVFFTIPGNPVGKPRMTQQDKWKKRPAVMRYRAWCDSALQHIPKLPSEPMEVHMKAFFALPDSYGEKKCALLAGQPHRQKPDADNILKCIDFLFKSDCMIAFLSIEKRWEEGNGPRLEIQVI